MVEFAVTDLDVTRFLRGRKIDRRFPDTNSVIPKGDGKFIISANPDYLIKILQQYKKMQIKTVRFDFYAENEPIKITGTNADKEQECLVVLMPTKTE